MRDKIALKILAFFVLIGLMLGSIFGALLNTANATADLNVGDTIEVFNTGGEGLFVRGTPCGEVIGGKFDGDTGVILDGPTHCEGYDRWHIRWGDDSLEGWSAEGWLKKKDITPSTKFSVGDTVKVCDTGDLGLVVRIDPPELTYKAMVYDGDEGTVMDGPFYGVPEGKRGFYYFWKVDYGDDTVGWSAEDWLCLSEVEDTTSPTISISSPSSGQTFITPTIAVEGTASDNVAVSKVEVKVGSENWQTASGITSWSIQVTLSSGSNAIYAKATDTSGNIEMTSVTVNYNPSDSTLYELPVTSGKISWFSSEESDSPGAWGEWLGESLGTDDATKYWYCAMRWPYAEWNPELEKPVMKSSSAKNWWHDKKILVTNPKNGKQVILAAKDWGPNPKTGRVIDVAQTALNALEANTDDVVNIDFADQNAPLGLITSDNMLGVKAVDLVEKVEGKGYHQGDTLSKGWNNGRFLDPQEISYFDCSGLVYWSYNRAWEMITGNRIPYYSTWYEDNNCVNEAPHPVFYLGASGQWQDSVRFEQISTEIPTVDDLKTGYLLFLDTDSNGLADHVGMYVGNGEVIHSKGGVGVERKPLNEWLDLSVAGGKYRDYFVGFGRVKQTSPLPTQPVTPIPSIETPQQEEPKQNPIQEVIEKIQGNIPTIIEQIQNIIGKIRSLFGF